MSKALSLELEILRDVLAAALAGSRVVEIGVSLEVWERLHAERPQHAYLFKPDKNESCRGFLSSTLVRPDAGTARWEVITASPAGITPALAVPH